MSPCTRGRALFILALVSAATPGCGAKATGPSGPAVGSDDCEPGRCMVDISQIIELHRSEARACYDAGYQRDPTLRGRLVINFEIDGTGTVLDASQSAQDDQIMDAGVVGCVEAVVRNLTFAKSAKGTSSRAFHRFEFSPP